MGSERIIQVMDNSIAIVNEINDVCSALKTEASLINKHVASLQKSITALEKENAFLSAELDNLRALRGSEPDAPEFLEYTEELDELEGELYG